MPETPKGILFLDHAAALGGAERSLLLLLGRLDRARWRPHLACAPGLLAKQAQALGVGVWQFGFPRLRRSPIFLLDWLQGAEAIARHARAIGARALYANTVRAAVYAALASARARLPFIWHMRDFWLSEAQPRLLWVDGLGKQLIAARAACVVANSRAVAARLPGRNAAVVYNGIEIEQFDSCMDGSVSSGGKFRAQYHLPPDVPLVGMVARLRPWKGQARFLRAMARVIEKLPEARFLIVGGEIFGVEADYERKLHHLANALGLAERVVFTGQLADVRPALAALDVFVHPGDPEPFGLVNIEAMAMGKPVVAFGHGALPEIVVDGETGLLVPPGEEGALAAAALALLCDPARRGAMGRAGRARVEQCFSAERMVAEIDAILTEALG